MQKYPIYKHLDLAKIAKEIHTFWKANDTFLRSTQYREDKTSFTLYEGPPSTNGEPGIHHVLARTLKDIVARYKTLKGYHVHRKSGWDTHGLPVELQVEKELGIRKEDIGIQISIKAYNKHCQETVKRYKKQWEELTEQLGYWIDTKNPYITSDRDYIETVWYLLKQLYEKGLLYKGHTIQPYSPAAGTGLSSHELNQPGCYKMVRDTTIVAQFKVKNTTQDYFLAWTTTPWTLPANSALAINEHINYVKVRTLNPYTYQPVHLILAEAALPRFFAQEAGKQPLKHYQTGDENIPWEVIANYTGKDLVGLEYEQLLPYVQPLTPAFRIIPGAFVSIEEGTGIVHIAPTFGSDDMSAAQKFNIPAITVHRNGQEVPIVDRQGRFVTEIKDWAGRYVRDAYVPEKVRQQPDYQPIDKLIATHLKKNNKAFQIARYEHNYPHCWRTDKPILYYPLDAWLIKTTAFKRHLIALNKTIHWHPSTTGTGRFENWLENLVDWNLSRDRFWGIPLPIWRTLDQQEEKCIGSLKELHQEIAKAVAAGFMDWPSTKEFDLHRPDVDDIVLVSSQREKMYRETAVIDVWFDSGAMPYAQWHYPFEHQSVFSKHFPADFIAEGVDQTRGWFFTLHVLAGILFNNIAFKNVVASGLVVDKEGNKMSKRLGNAIDPFQVMNQHGADALRWYMISNAHPWENLKFDPEGPVEVTRRFFATLQSSYNFFALYANLDAFIYNNPPIPLAQCPEIDRWIISRLNTLNRVVTVAYETYEPTKASRAIENFVVNDLSNWYIRLNRKRFWKNEQSTDKQAAYQTLFTCLNTVAQLASPIAPFYTERLYQDLHTEIQYTPTNSVHLSDWPQPNEAAIDTSLEQKMQQAQIIVYLTHSIRKKHNIKVRQPLSKLVIPVSASSMQQQIASVEDLILGEVNVKHIQYVDDTNSIITKTVKPNFKHLGQRYKGYMKAISQAISQLTQADIQILETKGYIQLPISQKIQKDQKNSGTTHSANQAIVTADHKSINIVIHLSDVIITSTDLPGWSVASQGDTTVALDIALNDSLRQEGTARDFVNRIQNIRKELGLAVQDKIKLTIAPGTAWMQEAITKHQHYICQETQALQFILVEKLIHGKKLIIDDSTLHVQVALQT